MTNYTASEMMIAAAARALREARTVFVGVGLPNIACNLAQRTGNPNLALIYESGVYGARPARLPLSIGDPTLVSGAAAVMPMADLFMYYLQGGLVDVALLGAAQIDPYGNLNSTVIGGYPTPKVRLPGSGGAAEIAINAKKVLIITRLQSRVFVEKLDFLTSPGHLTGSGERERLGLPGAGPQLIITDRCTLGVDLASGKMWLDGLYPGETVEGIQTALENWREFPVSPDLHDIEPPGEEDLRIIREELDPDGLYRK